jgi:hypothetical protein
MRFALLALAITAGSPRHDDRVSASKITVEGREVTWEVDVSRMMMEDVVKFPADPVDLTEAELQSVKEPLARYLGSCLSLKINGEPVPAQIGELTPESAPFVASGQLYIYRMHQAFRFQSPREIRSLELDLNFFADRMVGHGTVRRITPATLLVTYRELHPTFWGTAGDGFLEGLRGYFASAAGIGVVLAFLLAARRGAEAAKVVISFAVAAGLAMLGAGRGAIHFTPGTIGSLAAATVLYVSLENFWLGDGPQRWILAFGLGLVHGANLGQGFADSRTALEENTTTSLVSFDLGIALGIGAVFLVAFPALGRLRGGEDPARHRRVLRGGSAFLAVVGGALLAQRLSGLAFLPAWMAG